MEVSPGLQSIVNGVAISVVVTTITLFLLVDWFWLYVVLVGWLFGGWPGFLVVIVLNIYMPLSAERTSRKQHD